ncbi:MAG: hypothetical protein GY757_37735 [bacterium]|nr:hypothetical protein [bacterium]
MKGIKEYMGKPFNKKIGFFPGMITYDMLTVPEIVKVDEMAYWSGMENSLQGLLFFLGFKMGWGKNLKRAEKFLRFLKFMGKGGKNHSDTAMKIVVEGTVNGTQKIRTVEVHATEDFLTALIPVIACEQLTNSTIKEAGSFTGSQIINTPKLMEALKENATGYQELWDSPKEII